MHMLPVVSSVVSAIGYDGETQWLDLAFVDGSAYRYLGVPPELFADLMNAKSKGRFINSRIKGKFLYTSVD
jgi:hypothetical protein